MIYGERRLSRYELGQIHEMHDQINYKCIDRKNLTEQLKIIGLPSRISRFDLAQRLKEIENKGGRL